MAEWSKPEKKEAQWNAKNFETGEDVSLENGEVQVCDRHTCHSAPRDVVLRLLAAEASDRLGWEWVPFRVSHLSPLFMHCPVGEWWYDNGTSGPDTPAEVPPAFRFNLVRDGSGFLPDLTPDQLLAALHGRQLLEDKMNETGK